MQFGFLNSAPNLRSPQRKIELKSRGGTCVGFIESLFPTQVHGQYGRLAGIGRFQKSQHVGIGGSGNVSDTRKIVNVSLAMLTPCAYPSFFDSVCVAHLFFPKIDISFHDLTSLQSKPYSNQTTQKSHQSLIRVFEASQDVLNSEMIQV